MTTAPLRNTVYLASPLNDWEARKDIYWGRAPCADPEISGLDQAELRTRIIQRNFETTGCHVFTLGAVETQQQSRSYSQILKSTLAEATLEEWINTAKAIAFVVFSGCLTVATTYYGVNFLFKRHDQMTRKLLRIHPIGDPHDYRLYSKGDFYIECFKTSGMLLMIPALAWVYWIGNEPTRSIFSVYAREKQPYRVVQKLEKLPSSMRDIETQVLANEISGQGWYDPVTTTEISLEIICSPRVLCHENHAFDVTSVLKSIFAHPLTNGKIWDFCFNGDMSTLAQEKLVRAIAALFCISKEKFLDCWNVEVTSESVPGNIDLNNLLTLARLMKFLQLIPPQAISDHLVSILLNEQRTLIHQLSSDPLSLTYCEVLGHPAFSFDRFLSLTEEI